MTEDRLTELLYEATNEACAKKDQVRLAVRRGIQARSTHTRKHHAAWAATAAAAVMLVCFMGFTEPGRALAASIWSMFAPEKPVEINIEGYTEDKKAILAPDTAEHYAFYYDETQFERVERDSADVLLARDLDSDLPGVFLEIRRIESMSAQALYEKALTPEAVDLGAVVLPITGYGMEIWRGQEWNSPVTILYWLDDGFGNAYEFTLHGFMEAYEGHMARMKQILTTFTIIQ